MIRRPTHADARIEQGVRDVDEQVDEHIPGGCHEHDPLQQRVVALVDGVERQVIPIPDWHITTRIDTSAVWPSVWRAVQCHRTQMSINANLATLPPEHHRALWGVQEFARVFSLVNGGRTRESDLFEGLP